jgi:hypothetical protein
MVVLMRALWLSLALASTLLSGCFEPSEPPCSYSCGPNGECPDDYSCAADNYCHLHGTGICFFSDAAVSTPQDGGADGSLDMSGAD